MLQRDHSLEFDFWPVFSDLEDSEITHEESVGSSCSACQRLVSSLEQRDQMKEMQAVESIESIIGQLEVHNSNTDFNPSDTKEMDAGSELFTEPGRAGSCQEISDDVDLIENVFLCKGKAHDTLQTVVSNQARYDYRKNPEKIPAHRAIRPRTFQKFTRSQTPRVQSSLSPFSVDIENLAARRKEISKLIMVLCRSAAEFPAPATVPFAHVGHFPNRSATATPFAPSVEGAAPALDFDKWKGMQTSADKDWTEVRQAPVTVDCEWPACMATLDCSGDERFSADGRDAPPQHTGVGAAADTAPPSFCGSPVGEPYFESDLCAPGPGGSGGSVVGISQDHSAGGDSGLAGCALRRQSAVSLPVDERRERRRRQNREAQRRRRERSRTQGSGSLGP
jgi:hypothetical protein